MTLRWSEERLPQAEPEAETLTHRVVTPLWNRGTWYGFADAIADALAAQVATLETHAP